MRHTVPQLAVLFGLLCSTPMVSAEPIIGGRFIEKPASALGTKPVFLAHLFNTDDNSLVGGNYQVGLEMFGKKGRKSFLVKPSETIPSGEVRTFRMVVTPSADERAGTFRLFTRIGDKTVYSDAYSFGGAKRAKDTSTSQVISIPLYTEAPPESSADQPPQEIPFEHEIGTTASTWKAPKPGTPNVRKPVAGAVTPAKPVVTAQFHAAPHTTPAKPVQGQRQAQGQAAPPSTASIHPTPSTTSPASNTDASTTAAATPKPAFDPSEFKTLKTIDEELIIYVIKKGDTLKSVAEKYYGNPAKERSIADLNFIEKASNIKVGEEIIVDVRPLKNNSTPEPKKKKSSNDSQETSQKNSGTITSYIIQNGDTLGSIAKKLLGKTTASSKILQANPGLDPKNLKEGTVIQIPEASGAKA